MIIDRRAYIQRWESKRLTIFEHIVKVLAIADENNLPKWLKELDTRARELATEVTKGRISNETYQEIIEDYEYTGESQIIGLVNNVIADYCTDPSNKNQNAYIRPFSYIDINTFFKAFVEAVQDSKENQKGKWLYGTLKELPEIAKLLKKAKEQKVLSVYKWNAKKRDIQLIYG